MGGGLLGAAIGFSLFATGAREVPVRKAAVEPRRWVGVGVGSLVVGGTF